MDPAQIFQRYRDEKRGAALEGFDLTLTPHLSRYTPHHPTAEAFVMFADLPPGQEAALLKAELDRLGKLGRRFEWKVHEFDRPTGLKALLEARGFDCTEPEAFMVLPTQAWSRQGRVPPGVRVDAIVDDRGLRDVIALQHALFQENFAWLFENYSRALRRTPPAAAMYCAYAGHEPIGTGWIDFPEKTSFAELHGGAVLPGHRGQGVFSALVDQRVRDARARGYDFLAVDAAPMSRPILERQGFQHICWTYPMRPSKS
ncbi:MAG TPA: GNAT family N-acetyltransferase [Opitutaceae bacterium]|nr:GNAT family N-acetyltransferase [Opitutaceae bacterium]